MPKARRRRRISGNIMRINLISHAFCMNASNLPSFPSSMLKTAGRQLRRLCPRFQWPHHRLQNNKINIPFFTSRFKSKPTTNTNTNTKSISKQSLINPQISTSPALPTPLRIATFNASMFSMAPAACNSSDHAVQHKSSNHQPRGILKQLPGLTKPKLRVSINLPDNEIERMGKGLSFRVRREGEESKRSVLDVLREVDADIIGLQNVKAEEEKGMRPLSDLAAGLGMKFVFAESWAPEYGNAVLSRFPIKQWKVQKVFDDSDFR